MKDALRQRCFHHPERVAGARCLGCGRTFCRECVTEHEGRVLCAPCLAAAARQETRRQGSGRILRAGAACAGIATAWLFFYLLGHALLLARSTFHEGTLWTDAASDE